MSWYFQYFNGNSSVWTRVSVDVLSICLILLSSSQSCYCIWQWLHLSRKWISLPQLLEPRSARITSMMQLLQSSRQVKWEIGYGSNVIWQLFSSYKLQWHAEGLGCNGRVIPALLKTPGEGKLKVTDLKIVSIN